MIRQIGLTGGIGSGKTTVAKIFESFGFEIYYADDRAKWLMNNDPELIKGIKSLFGEDIYADGQLDRKRLAGIVFEDKALLEKLNSIVHPATYRDAETWLKGLEGDYDKAFVLKEAAILFETGSYKKLDGMITVYAPEKIRIERVCQRDGVEAAQVRARMANQMPDEEKLKLADFTIYNDGQHHLIPQVKAAIEFFSGQ